MATAPTYTKNQWATALVSNMISGLAGGQIPQTSVAFVIGWIGATAPTAEATYNCLSLANGPDLAQYHPTISGGVIAFSRFADGVAATAGRIQNSQFYQAIAIALANEPANLNIQDVGGNLGVGIPYSPSDAIKKALGVWVNGPNGGPISQAYLDNIGRGITNGGDILTGVAGDTTISSATTGIFQNSSGNTTTINPAQIIKVLGGALMILAGVALLIKSLGAGTVQKVIGTK